MNSRIDELVAKFGDVNHLVDVFNKWGWKVADGSIVGEQPAENVVFFKSPRWRKFYSGTVVKGIDENCSIVVDYNKLLSYNTDRVFHVNREANIIAWYGVKEMIGYCRGMILLSECDKIVEDTGGSLIIEIGLDEMPSFVTVQENAA